MRVGARVGAIAALCAGPAFAQGLPGHYGQGPAPVPVDAPYATAPQGHAAAYGAQAGGWRPPPPVLSLRAEQPYRGGDVPDGYHLEDRVRVTPLVTGAAIWGTAYFFAVMGGAGSGFENGTAWLVVPVAGPWLTLGEGGSEPTDCPPSVGGGAVDCVENGDDIGVTALLVLDGFLQATGGAVMLVGLLAKRTWLVRDTAEPSWTIAPMRVGSSGHGVGWSGRW